jgi:integrase
MARKATELGALAVKNLKMPGLHFVGGVAGLALQIAPGGSKSWVLRATMGKKRRDMGLGGYPDVTLAGAQEAARGARKKIREGIDPIDDGKRARSALEASRAHDVTFKEFALSYLARHEEGWSTKSHQQWLRSLETHVFPKIGSLLVRDIDVAHVEQVLDPIWKSKTETATRVRGRIETILDSATVAKHRSGENPARWKGNLKARLVSPKKLKKAEHFKALPYKDVGAFMQRLSKVDGQGARALEFAILTAARSTQARGALWSEISAKEALWVIPKERMKSKREHRVPLSQAALNLLEKQPRIEETDLVFPSVRRKMISDATMSAVLKRMGVDAVPHGFRSSFKDWCSELTHYPPEVSEMALAHAVGDPMEEAYRRGDLLVKRRRVMEDWAKFCSKPYVQESADVIQLHG